MFTNFPKLRARFLKGGKKFGLALAPGLFIFSIGAGWALLPTPPAATLPRGLFTAYGPADFVRGDGSPAADTRSFRLPGVETEYRLQLFNGGLGSQFAPVSSAVVALNGRQVAQPSDFNQNARLIERRITPSAANSLAVELRGAPRSGVTLRVVGVDNEPPTVVAHASPEANADGWNNSDVTVSFVCDDPLSGVENCSPPATLGGEGAGQVVTGTATDRAQNSAQATLTLNIDKTPPSLVVTSPENGAAVNGQTLTVEGSVVDSLSGVGGVTCDGVDATLSGDSFTCERTLEAGENSIMVEAWDKAGNRASSSINVTGGGTAPPKEEPDIKSARVEPDVLFVGESSEVTFSARISYPATAPAPQVTLQRVDAAGNVLGIEGLLLDDGDAARGDQMKGDGLYSFRRSYTADAARQSRFRISYQQDGRELKSDLLKLGFYERPTAAQIDAMLSTQHWAAERYETLLASVGKASARTTLLSELRQRPGVMKAGANAGGTMISVLYSPGIIGGIYLHEPGLTMRGGGGAGSRATGGNTARADVSLKSTTAGSLAQAPSVPAAALADEEADGEEMIESKRALILSPFSQDFAPEESTEIALILGGNSCPTYEVNYHADQDTSVDSFKNMEDYGIIAIVSHGEMMWQGLFSPDDNFHGLPLGIEVYSLVTSENVSPDGIIQRMNDLLSGRLTIFSWSRNEMYFGILPTFIPYYSPGQFPNSLVYMGTCSSARNDTMARAFFGQGAKTYLGYTKPVWTEFARQVSTEFFQRFMEDPMRSTGGPDGAYIPDKYDISPCLWDEEGHLRPECRDLARREEKIRAEGARFTLFGSEELSRPHGIINGGFEAGDMDWWSFVFDSRVVGQFGNIRPTGGSYMGMVSKSQTWFGTLAQDFCLPPDARRIEFDWNMVTEQDCANPRMNPDELWVRIKGPDIYHQVLTVRLRTECPSLVPTTADLPSSGAPRATGWRHASVDLSGLAQTRGGQSMSLSFEVVKAVFSYDLFQNSAVFIDNVRIVRR